MSSNRPESLFAVSCAARRVTRGNFLTDIQTAFAETAALLTQSPEVGNFTISFQQSTPNYPSTFRVTVYSSASNPIRYRSFSHQNPRFAASQAMRELRASSPQ